MPIALLMKPNMQGKHLYEYAVIRVVPLVEREEFINAGIVLFCKRPEFIRVLVQLNEERLGCFSQDTDVDLVRRNLEAFQSIAAGTTGAGPIAAMDLPSRFRWLTAVRSSVIQTSRPHPGLCNDLEATAQRLFQELVL